MTEPLPAGKTPKLVVFGVDGGDFAIIDALVAQGELPNFTRFLADAAHAEMECTWPSHTAPGWASLVTGRGCGGHGVYQFFHTQDPDYGARVVRSSDVACDTLWDWITAAGLSVGLINIPMSHPPLGYDGYEVTWPLENTLRFSAPSSLLGEMAANGCGFLSDLASMYRGKLDYIDFAVSNVDARAKSARYLMSTRPTDVVMVVLTEVDRVCHHYWHFSDPTHPSFEAEAAPSFRDAILNVYRATDRALGDITRDLPPETVVAIVSDHGIGPGHDCFSVHQLLSENGFLTMRERSGAPMAPWFVEGEREIDFAQTAAYMPVPGCYGLNLNLRGRQRLGTVSLEDRDRLLGELRDLCLSIRSPRTGEPVFAAAVAREEIYEGGAVDRAPDLVLVPADERIMMSGHLDGPTWKPSYQTGHHRHTGMWMLRSPSVRPGRLGRTVRIIDVAPTLLATLGLPLPDTLEGRVIADAFLCEPATGGQDRPQRPGDGIVIEHLRAMGYL